MNMLSHRISENNEKYFVFFKMFIESNFEHFKDIDILEVNYTYDYRNIIVDFFCSNHDSNGFVEFESLLYYEFLYENCIIERDELYEYIFPPRPSEDSLIGFINSGHDNSLKYTDVVVVILLIITVVLFYNI